MAHHAPLRIFGNALWRELAASRDETLAALAAKAEKEAAYHLRHAGEWLIRLGIEAPSSVVVDRQEIHARRGRVPKSAAEPCCIVEPTKKEMLKKLLTPILA